MNIEVEARDKFLVMVEPAELKLLQKLARHHYDYTCKQTVAIGGNMVDNSNLANLGADHLTWRELDILAKICEGYRYLPSITDGQMVFGMVLKIQQAFSTARKTK